MDRDEAIRVVAVDGTPPATRSLRPLLRADGFNLCGQASTSTELQDVVHLTHPDVVVFGTEAPVETVVAARGLAPGAGIVVVWPPDVAAFDADEQVDPAHATSELGTAVRAAHRQHTLRATPSTGFAEVAPPNYVSWSPHADETVPLGRRPAQRYQPLLGGASFLLLFVLTLVMLPAIRTIPFAFDPVFTLPAFGDPLFPSRPEDDPIMASGPSARSDTSVASVALESADQPSRPPDDIQHLGRQRPSSDDGRPTGGAADERSSNGNGGSGAGTGGGVSAEPRSPDSPGNSGGSPGHSGGSPGNSGGSPGNSGGSPGHSGGSPGNSGSSPGHSGGSPGNSGGSHGNAPRT